MSAGAPWSVKGIDPKAREIAKDLARRQGMTLGEWLNQMIIDGGEPEAPPYEPPPSPFRRQGPAPAAQRAPYSGRGDYYDDGDSVELSRITQALEALSS